MSDPTGRASTRRSQWLLLAYVNVSLVCVMLAGAELAGQVLFYAKHGYALIESDRHVITEGERPLLEYDPHLVARLAAPVRITQLEHTVTVTPQHTRSTGVVSAGAGAIRVAVVGGSTTFGSGMNDEDTWPSRLQAMLGDGFRVTNFGMPGYSSAESVVQMALLVPESRPDIVVVYQGWNDLHNYHETDLGPDYRGHAVRLLKFLGVEPPRPPSAFEKLASTSAVVHFARSLSRRVHPPRTPGATGDSSPLGGGQDIRDVPDTLVDRLYLRNLRTMKRLADGQGAFMVFVPQVLDSTRFRGETGSWWTARIRNSATPGLMRHLNERMRLACGTADSGCVVLWGVEGLSWTHEDFIDEGHFSVQGNEKFARFVFSELQRMIALRRMEPPRTRSIVGQR